MSRRSTLVADLEARWPDGTLVRVKAPHPHAGRLGKVLRVRRADGQPVAFLPHCLRVVLDLPMQGASGDCYARPNALRRVSA